MSKSLHTELPPLAPSSSSSSSSTAITSTQETDLRKRLPQPRINSETISRLGSLTFSSRFKSKAAALRTRNRSCSNPVPSSLDFRRRHVLNVSSAASVFSKGPSSASQASFSSDSSLGAGFSSKRRRIPVRLTITPQKGTKYMLRQAYRSYKNGKGMVEIYQTRVVHDTITTPIPTGGSANFLLPPLSSNAARSSKSATEFLKNACQSPLQIVTETTKTRTTTLLGTTTTTTTTTIATPVNIPSRIQELSEIDDDERDGPKIETIDEEDEEDIKSTPDFLPSPAQSSFYSAPIIFPSPPSSPEFFDHPAADFYLVNKLPPLKSSSGPPISPVNASYEYSIKLGQLLQQQSLDESQRTPRSSVFEISRYEMVYTRKIGTTFTNLIGFFIIVQLHAESIF